MKPKIILYKKSLNKKLLHKLEETYQVDVFDGMKSDPLAFQKALQKAVGLIGWGGRIDQNLIHQAPHLKAVSTISVGYDHCDLKALSDKGIALMHTPAVLTETVADTALALMLATSHRLVEMDQKLRQGFWKGPMGSEWYGVNVHHKTLGIIGLGRIGLAIARRAHHGFQMPILYYSRSKKPEAEGELKAQYCAQLKEVLQKSDFICCALPSTPQTQHLISSSEFQAMKTSAIFINIGRGNTVDEAALIQALQSQDILAAGLDVFEKEPLDPQSPLMQMSNVVLLPHIASATHETREAMDECAVNNLLKALQGPTQENCVNPEVFNKA